MCSGECPCLWSEASRRGVEMQDTGQSRVLVCIVEGISINAINNERFVTAVVVRVRGEARGGVVVCK